MNQKKRLFVRILQPMFAFTFLFGTVVSVLNLAGLAESPVDGLPAPGPIIVITTLVGLVALRLDNLLPRRPDGSRKPDL